MSKYELSVVIPSIRVANLEKIYFMLEKAIEPYNWELIVIGPYVLQETISNKENVKYLKDFGSPGRCVQLGSLLAEGTYIMWMSDDCVHINQQALAECVKLLESRSAKDAICLRYFEGSGNGEFERDYWRAKHHDDMQQLSGVPDDYKIAPLGMYNTEFFRSIGGLDCKYEHINMNCHDLAFRTQNNGGEIILSPRSVACFYWSWITSDAKPVQEAYNLNDKDLFKEMWNQDQSKRILIPYYNWTEAPSVWKRRFGN